MKKTVNGVTVELKGSQIVLKNSAGETYKAIDCNAVEAVAKFNAICAKLAKAAK
jgi:hypothetical protein